MEVQIDQTKSNEAVDNGERVRDHTVKWLVYWRLESMVKCHLLEDEIVCISRRWSEHDDDRDKPVLRQTCKWCIEWPITGEESRER